MRTTSQATAVVLASALALLAVSSPRVACDAGEQIGGHDTRWQSDQSLQDRLVADMQRPLKSIKLTSSCIPRRTEEDVGEAAAGSLEHGRGSMHYQAEADVGAVLVLTDNGALEALEALRCTKGNKGAAASDEAWSAGADRDEEPHVVAFSFIIPLHSGLDPARLGALLTRLKPCTKAIQTPHPATVMDELPRPQVTTQYLDYIAREFHGLQSSILFMELPRDAALLSRGLEEAKSGRWHYLPLNPTSQPMDLEDCVAAAPDCNVTQLQEEVLSLYGRFTCEQDTCNAEVERLAKRAASSDSPHLLDTALPCLLPEVHRSFVASAERIREVTSLEYAWLSYWLQSWEEVARGPRMLAALAHRFWPLLLGCPELLHSSGPEQPIQGCLAGMHFKSGGTAAGKSDPDPRLFHPGVVSIPRPADLHHYRPKGVPWLRSDAGRKVSFVVTCGEIPGRGEPPIHEVLKGLVGTAALWHQYSSVVVLSKKRLAPELTKSLESQWFANRVEVVAVDVSDDSPPWMGFGDATAPDSLAQQHPSLGWIYSQWFQLVVGWLKGAPTWGRGAGELKYGHLVFVPPNTVARGPVWPIFQGEPFAIGFPHAEKGSDCGGKTSPPGVMFVHRERIWQAEMLMSDIEERITQQRGAVFVDTLLEEQLARCEQGMEALASGATIVSRCPAVAGQSPAMSAAVKLMESDTWAGLRCLDDTQEVTVDEMPKLLLQQVLPLKAKVDEAGVTWPVGWEMFRAIAKAEEEVAGRKSSLQRIRQMADEAKGAAAAHQCPENTAE